MFFLASCTKSNVADELVPVRTLVDVHSESVERDFRIQVAMLCVGGNTPVTRAGGMKGEHYDARDAFPEEDGEIEDAEISIVGGAWGPFDLNIFGRSCSVGGLEGMEKRGSVMESSPVRDLGPALGGLTPGLCPSAASGRKAFEEATVALSAFCRCPAKQVEPRVQDLAALLKACEVLPRAAVCKAFHEQLTWSSGDEGWQPRLRALHALHYFGQHAEGAGVARRTASEARELLQHLVDDVPQCRAKASEVRALAEF